MSITLARTTQEKAACYDLRHRVFVEEQGVPVELEIDEHDESIAIHFLGKIEDQPVATARICVFGGLAKIQRVAIDQKHRGRSLGRDLMLHLIAFAGHEQLAPTVALDAQTYATGFYESLGFSQTGDVFDDAGIDHIRMVMPVNAGPAAME